MLRKNDGITMLALMVTVIILAILATVTIYTVTPSIKSSRYARDVAQLKVMQVKINQIYEEYRNGDATTKTTIENYGQPIPESQKEEAQGIYKDVEGGNVNGENLGEFNDYRLYNAAYIKGTLDLDGIDKDYIVNIKTRSIISLDSIVNDGEIYHALCEIKNEQYNVPYTNTTP